MSDSALNWASNPVDPRGSVFLLTGGLVTLAFLLPIALFRNRHPPDEPAQAIVAAPARSVQVTMQDGGQKHRSAPAPPAPDDPEFDRGRRAGGRLATTVRTVDELLERLHEADFGEPRIVRSLPNLYVVGLYGCRGCSPSNPVGTSRRARGCTFECGVIEGSFAQLLDDDVVAREVACRARGHAYCEFEVWY